MKQLAALDVPRSAKPRGWLAVFSWYWPLGALPWAIGWPALMSPVLHARFIDVFVREGLVGGILFGTVVGAVMAHRMRLVARSVVLGARGDDSIAELTVVLAELNYHPEVARADIITFAPAHPVSRFLGRLTIAVRGSRATVLGPAWVVRQIWS